MARFNVIKNIFNPGNISITLPAYRWMRPAIVRGAQTIQVPHYVYQKPANSYFKVLENIFLL
ncbi:MAG TPA: hypothetical protein VIL78_01910 [Hanamia sp.]